MSKECITKTTGLEKEALTYCAYILHAELKLEFKIEVLLHLFVLSQAKLWEPFLRSITPTPG